MTKKEKFKQWLLALNNSALNEIGIDEILFYLNDDLVMIKGNEIERQILSELISMFYQVQ